MNTTSMFFINLTGFWPDFDNKLIIYTVVYKESESEAKKHQILDAGGKNHKIIILW